MAFRIRCYLAKNGQSKEQCTRNEKEKRKKQSKKKEKKEKLSSHVEIMSRKMKINIIKMTCH